MEITRQQSGDVLEMRVAGRLDAYWADHLSAALEEAVRNGARHLSLNLADVTFVSSAGLRVLLVYYRQLKGIQGSLVVTEPSPAVREVLELAGFGDLLIEEPPSGGEDLPDWTEAGKLSLHGIRFETYTGAAAGEMACRVIGDPELLLGCAFRADHCRQEAFPEATIALGLGAFGSGFDDCRERFGEFLAAAGSAAYLPTDGTNVADYFAASGSFVPQMQVLYGLACEGPFTALARFETGGRGEGATLSQLADASLQLAGADTAAVAMVAESGGLVGAALRRSPGLDASVQAPFGFPEVRQWLSFSAERTHTRALALVVGVVSRAPSGPLAALLRPLGGGGGAPAQRVVGHFHAGAFSYRPLQAGEIDLKQIVTTLFESERLQGVLHLLHDDREIAGAGESEFLRGAMWVAPVTRVAAEVVK